MYVELSSYYYLTTFCLVCWLTLIIGATAITTAPIVNRYIKNKYKDVCGNCVKEFTKKVYRDFEEVV